MAITTPTPVDTGTTTPVTSGPPTKTPSTIPPGPGSTGTVYTAPAPVGPPETAPPAVSPGAGTGQSTQAAAAPAVPVVETPVDTAVGGGGSTTNVVPRPVPNYIEVLANGEIVVQNATALNFIGNGVSITANSSVATLTINTAGYNDSNVSTYLANFGSNVLSTTGNVTAGYFVGNGSALTGISSYGNSNVVTLLAGFGSNTISTTGSVTGGNVLTGGLISATGNITGGNVLGGANVNATTHTGTTISVSANVTGGNILTAGLISATGNITGGNITLSTLVTANSVVSRLLTITSSVSNVLLNATSSQNILVNGSTSQYVFLPNAQTLTTGATYTFNDNSSQPVYICYNDGTLLGTLAAGGLIEVQLLTNSTSNGTWDRHSGIPSYVGWGSTGLTMGNGNITGATIISASANVTGGNVLTGGLISATGNITGGNISTLGELKSTGTFLIGTQAFYPQGSDGFSVNENFNAGNSTVTAYHYTSGTGRSAVVFDTAVTGQFTTGFGATGTAATNQFVQYSENANTTWEWRKNVGISAPNLNGGTLIANINPNGNLYTIGTIVGTGNITGGNLTTAGLASTASLSVTGNTATITTANYSIGYLNIPQVSLAANTTIALTDAGKHYYTTSSSNLALTIANNTSVSWAVGTAISIVNGGTANILINQGTGVSMYLAGNATSGNRVLSTFGMATIMNTAANVWFINGTGLT